MSTLTNIKYGAIYFLCLNVGILAPIILYAVSGLHIDDASVFTFERFAVKHGDEWNADTLIYAFMEYQIWAISLLSISTVFRRCNPGFKTLLLCGAIGGVMSFAFQFSSAITDWMETKYLPTYYHWMYVFIVTIFIFGFFKRDQFTLVQRFCQSAALALYLFVSFIHFNFVFLGLYPLVELATEDQARHMATYERMARSMPPKGFVRLMEREDHLRIERYEWPTDAAMPDEAKKAEDILASIGDQNGGMLWSHLLAEGNRASPVVVINYAGHSSGTNYFLKSMHISNTLDMLYPTFFFVLYVSLAAFSLVWGGILCFILSAHRKVSR